MLLAPQPLQQAAAPMLATIKGIATGKPSLASASLASPALTAASVSKRLLH